MNKKVNINQYTIDLNLDKVFCVGSTMLNRTLRNTILRNNLIKYECSICKSSDEWQNKKLLLQLDHINGLPYDNRLENLRFLCPNCHSQTETFCVGSRVNIDQKWRKRPKFKNRAVKGRPNKIELQRLIKECNNWSKIGRMFDVSSNAVRKWAVKYGIILVKRKYVKRT